jgi:hypothetical protein
MFQMIKLLKRNTLTIVLLLSMAGCAPKPLIKVDIDTYVKNQAQYEDKNVVIVTTLKDVMAHYDLYKRKDIELSAPVTYYGKSLFWTWYLMLEKDGMKLRCYEDKYRQYPDSLAVDVGLRARSSGDEVTVRGKLYSDGISLDRIIYDGYDINTNNPVRPTIPLMLRY